MSFIRRYKLAIILLIAVLIGAAGLLVLGGMLSTPSATINESANDLQVNVSGSNSAVDSLLDNRGIVDIVSASLEKNQSSLSVLIQVKDPIIALGDQESAQFDVIIILEDEQDVLETYECLIDLNSTGQFCLFQDVQGKTQLPAELYVDGSVLSVTTALSELSDVTKAEWNVTSYYEKLENNQVICSVYDFVPDEGLKTSVFEP